jgi:GTPase
VPWNWGKKETEAPRPPGAGSEGLPEIRAPDTTSSVPSSETPISGEVRVRVTAVYTITGTGCVVVGEVATGDLRLPATLRIVDARTGAPHNETVQVVRAEVHRREETLIRAGTTAGLVLQGVPEARRGLSRGGGWDVQPGDFLVSP